MITISREALALFHDRRQPIHLDLPPPLRSGCCVGFQERPSVRFGPPREPGDYQETFIQGIRVFLPRRLPPRPDFRIALSSFLGFRWPMIEGWSPF
jgi:hypothetical protein